MSSASHFWPDNSQSNFGWLLEMSHWGIVNIKNGKIYKWQKSWPCFFKGGFCLAVTQISICSLIAKYKN